MQAGFSRRAVLAIGLIVTVAITAACGGTKNDVPDAVKLAGTAIPTVTAEPTQAPVCEPTTPVTIPANFPPEITLPQVFVPWSVETTPHLRVIGRVQDPAGGNSADVQAVIEPQIVAALRTKFEIASTPGPNGGYVISLPDGSKGEFLATPVEECPGQVELFYDIYWVTG